MKVPVEDDIDLRTVSADELNQINKEYEELERKAREIEKVKNKIKADITEANFLAGGAPMDIGHSSTQGAGGIFGGETSRAIGFQESKRSAGSGIKLGGGLLSGAGAPIHKGQFVEEVKKATFDIKQLKQQQAKIFSTLQQGLGSINDPLGFLKSGALGALTKFAIPVGAAITIATMVFEMVKSQFGPGGLFDIRKIILDEVREFNSLDDLIKMDRGEIYFSSRATLTQQAPDFANTESKVDGHLKDILRNAGY